VRNDGIINTGSGHVDARSAVFGTGNVVSGERTQSDRTQSDRTQSDRTQDQAEPGPPPIRHWDVGVITVLACESRAVADVLRGLGTCASRQLPEGIRCDEAEVVAGGARAGVVAVRTTSRGQISAAVAFTQLQQHYQPAVTALVGIAGSVHPSAEIGDVVIAQGVVYYEPRKVLPEGVHRRGRSQLVPAPVQRAINGFFDQHGEPCELSVTDPDDVRRAFKVLPGLIGSGEAVIASDASQIRGYLRAYNDQVLAVETEAAGIAEAFYEYYASTSAVGWLAVRGIADKASRDKSDDWQEVAAWHAAHVLGLLLPHLVPLGRGDPPAPRSGR
jgi:adenosylhomocysteine nucleosidase